MITATDLHPSLGDVPNTFHYNPVPPGVHFGYMEPLLLETRQTLPSLDF